MFDSVKKEENKEVSCCCGGNCIPESTEVAEKSKMIKEIKVLGGGCAKCHALKENTEAALRELEINTSVELITDFSVIAAYGVMSTPALVVNEEVVSFGKVLKKENIAAILMEKLK